MGEDTPKAGMENRSVATLPTTLLHEVASWSSSTSVPASASAWTTASRTGRDHAPLSHSSSAPPAASSGSVAVSSRAMTSLGCLHCGCGASGASGQHPKLVRSRAWSAVSLVRDDAAVAVQQCTGRPRSGTCALTRHTVPYLSRGGAVKLGDAQTTHGQHGVERKLGCREG